MTLKVTLKIDPEYGVEIIALLAKAFSRGELGVGDIRIERWASEEPAIEAVKTRVAKMLEATKPKRKQQKRSSYEIGMRAKKSGKANGVVVVLKGLALDASRDGLLAMWKAVGLNANGLSATLSKLKARGYITSPASGVWRLSPVGTEFVRQWRQDHDHKNGE